MPSKPPPPEKLADIEALAEEIREAVDAEIDELAANLATTDDAHLFGKNEFRSAPWPTGSPPRPSSGTWREKKRI